MRNTNILVKSTTVERLKGKKGKNSHDTYLNLMLDYFDRNEITPFQDGVLNSVLINQNTERIIKILRAYERDYFKPTKSFSEYGATQSFEKNSPKNEPIEVKKDLVSNNSDLKKIEELESKIQLLELEKKQLSEKNTDSKIDRVLEILRTLDDKKKEVHMSMSSQRETSFVEIFFNQKMESMRSILKNIKG